MRTFLRKLWWFMDRSRRERDLDEELQFHLDSEAAEQRGRGATPEDAQRLARLDLGNRVRVREDTQAAWTWSIPAQVAGDVRYAGRMMARNPVFTVVTVLSLALGIGANIALFGFTDALLLRDLPVADPPSLVRFTTWTPKSEVHGTSYHDSSYNDQAGYTDGVFAYPAFELFKRDPAFSTVFAYQSTGRVGLSLNNAAQPATGEYVSGGYFGALGIAPAAGRWITDDDDRPGAPLVAIADYALAAGHFDDVAAAVGAPLYINNHRFTVIGVAPRAFFGTDPGMTPSIYVPLHANLVLDADRPSASPAAVYRDPSETWLEVMARLKPGGSLIAAQAQVAPMFHRYAEYVTTLGRWHQVQELHLLPGARGIDGLRRAYERPVIVLLALAAVILALACTNIASLLLARTGARSREIALRLSLGAGRPRIVRQLLTESIVLGCLGGAAGLAVAVWCQRVLVTLITSGRDDLFIRTALNTPVLAVTIGTSILTGVLFGLLPAISATRAAGAPIAVGDLQSKTPGTPRRGPRRILLAVQVALTLMMLVAAGLFGRTLSSLQAINTGFQPAGLLTLTMDARDAGLKGPSLWAFYRDVEARLRSLPDVTAVTLSDNAVIGDGRSATMVDADGTRLATIVLNTGGRFFDTLHIPLIRGRGLTDADLRAGAPPVLVVSQALATQAFGATDPIGRQLWFRTDSAAAAQLAFAIVGVAADVKIATVERQKGWSGASPVCYLPFTVRLWGDPGRIVYEIRSRGDLSLLAPSVRRLVQDANPRVPIDRLAPQTALIDQTMSSRILLARLCTGFAGLALAIAVIGLYGAAAYDLSRRTAEIGIRMALGATRARIIMIALREVTLVIAAGLGVGIPIALSIGHVAQSLLYGLTARDPSTIIAAAVVLALPLLIAGVVPALAAARLDPMVALRAE